MNSFGVTVLWNDRQTQQGVGLNCVVSLPVPLYIHLSLCQRQSVGLQEVYDAAIVRARIQTKTLILCANQATCTISIQAVQWDTLQRRCADEVKIIWLD